jgi:TRAP-type C4-dicarboxylate transport system permease small subunit
VLESRSFLEEDEMSPTKMAAMALIVVGILALVYGGFTYTKDTHDAKIGPLELSVKDKERVNIPVWAGVGAIVIGGGLLLVRQDR